MEKEGAVEHVRSASSSTNQDAETQSLQDDPKWQPGFKARFPWIGFAALVTILLCAGSSVAILEASDGCSQSHWPRDAAPNVLLNVMNSVENVCFTIAIGNGIAIAWWRKAIKGSSIVDMHRSWAFSTSMKEMVLSIKYFNIIALAALTAKLTFVDSSLMQRATDTYLAMDSPDTVSNVTGFVNQTFPTTGTVTPVIEAPGLLTHSMGDTLKLWHKEGGVYPNYWKGCEGYCYVNVTGIGFAFDCDAQVQESINYGEQLNLALQNGIAGTRRTLFEISFGAHYSDGANTAAASESSHLLMNVTFTKAHEAGGELSCPGTRYTQSCRLLPALIKYPVQIQNTSAEFSVSIGARKPKIDNHEAQDDNLGQYDRSIQQQTGYEVVKYIPIPESHSSTENGIFSVLSGIQLGLDMYIVSRSHISWQQRLGADGEFIIDQLGHAANYMTDPPSDPKSCAFNYENPLDPYDAPNGDFKLPSIIGKINSLMFGLSTDISRDDDNNDRHDTTAFNATRYKQTIHYKTHFDYMWGAIAATVVCVLLVLPVYWGFWELGRKVSLNPFEIAYAFRSPVVNRASTAVTDDLLKEIGGHQIKYGPIVAGDGLGRFGMAEPQNVAQPAGVRSSWRASWLSS